MVGPSAEVPAGPPATDRPPDLSVRELTGDDDLRAALPVARALRPHLTEQTFSELVRRQRTEGYTLVGGFAAGRLVAVAGYRLSCTLSRGPHLFVDDLVTAPGEQGKGYGAAMVGWLRATARSAGVARVYLDSRDTAVGFYERAGFTFLTAKPCWVEAGGGGSVPTKRAHRGRP